MKIWALSVAVMVLAIPAARAEDPPPHATMEQAHLLQAIGENEEYSGMNDDLKAISAIPLPATPDVPEDTQNMPEFFKQMERDGAEFEQH